MPEFGQRMVNAIAPHSHPRFAKIPPYPLPDDY